jgi:hypothetical protein
MTRFRYIVGGLILAQFMTLYLTPVPQVNVTPKLLNY